MCEEFRRGQVCLWNHHPAGHEKHTKVWNAEDRGGATEGGGGVMTSQLTVLEDKEESCCGPSSSRTGLKRSAYFEFCSLVNVRELVQ